MKNKHIWIPAFVFIGAAVFSLIYSVIDYKAINKVQAYSSETIQFNYDGASDGKDPNGNSFNPVSFLSDDIIKDALDASELTYEVEQVKPYIILENVVPNNIVEEISSYEKIMGENDSRKISSKDYHPVRYRFVVYQDLDSKLSTGKLNEFVSNLVTKYSDKFYVTYKKTFADNAYQDLFNLDNYDYIYQSQIMSTRLEVLMDYADNIYKEHDDFLIDGKSFRDLYLKAQTLINTDANKINNIIVLNALSKDVQRLKDYYTYLIERLNYDKTKYTSDLNAITAQVNNYEIDSTVYVGTGENIIKVESNSVETYNALLAKQISTSNMITSIEKQIADYQNILDTLNSATSTEEVENTVKNMIVKLGTDYNNLETLFKTMIGKYNDEYVMKDTIATSNIYHNNASIFSSSFIVRAIKVSAPIMMVAVLGIAIFYLVRAVRKEKKVA